MKTCTMCKIEKDLSEYNLTSNGVKSYPHSRCKECVKKVRNVYRKNGEAPLTKKQMKSLCA